MGSNKKSGFNIFDSSDNKKLFISEIEEILAPYFAEKTFKAGTILWNEGESARRMISIISGRVKIFRPLTDGKQAAIYIFEPGDTFGFMPMIDGSSYPASAEVIEDMKAHVMTSERLFSVMRENPEIAVFLLQHLGKRLKDAFDQIKRLSTKGVVPRTAAALLSLSVKHGKENLEVITLPVSSREYASLAGLTPESFSRGVTKLVDMGIILRLKGNSFQILDHGRLISEAKNEI